MPLPIPAGVRYHISKRTGDVLPCSAKIECPFGDMVTEHWSSPKIARAAYEARNQDQTFNTFLNKKPKVSPIGNIRRSKDRFMVPKGVYVICDPVSLLKRRDPAAAAEWKELADKDPNDETMAARVNGYPIMAFKTDFEDGIFLDTQNREFAVHEGVVGLVPVSLARRMGMDEEDIVDEGYFIDFDEDAPMTKEDGNINFGDYLWLKLQPEAEDLDDLDEDFDEKDMDEELHEIENDTDDEDYNYDNLNEYNYEKDHNADHYRSI